MTPRDYLTRRLADLAEVRETWALDDELLIGSQAEIASLSATVEVIAAALIAVLDLHGMATYYGPEPEGTFPICKHCPGVTYYPCPTVRAITDALGADK